MKTINFKQLNLRLVIDFTKVYFISDHHRDLSYYMLNLLPDLLQYSRDINSAIKRSSEYIIK